MQRGWIIVVSAFALFAGCDRQSTVSNSPTTKPAEQTASAATQPAPDGTEATTAAATAPAQPLGAGIFITENGNARQFFFPAARLRLMKEGNKYSAVLYSDDPKTAINPDYAGNSFFIRMSLDVEDPTQLSGADWKYASPESAHREGSDGIFLDGNHYHLQPAEIGAVLSDQSKRTVQIMLYGSFLKFDVNQPNAPGVLVAVHGEFTATVEVAK